MGNILVTGSNGQLGNEIRVLADTCTQHRYFFTDIDELDICNEKAVDEFVSKNNITYIINCAAYTAVDKAEQEQQKAFEINATAVDNLCKAAKTAGAFMLQISTDYVFDGTKNTPYIETDKVNPVSVYGKSKLKGEEFVLSHGLPALIVRTSWLYSSFGNNFVKTILRLAKEKAGLRIIADQYGTPTYARDLAKAVLQVVSDKTLPRSPEIYHFSNAGETNWYGFAKAITELSGINIPVEPIQTKDYPTAATRPPYSVFSKEKIIRDFNLHIPDWKDSLKACLDILNKNN
ncbi:MAG TPA: dTDP-4-dehydrorhamnose reductase [Bacteroidales bacterium]|nr:dTDP-4-dehydrorhamnose reductase [Bacteroidales bacterium]HPB25533.1 dTDP-4-dehydrorhamnose reductase [Bacteroidales bacterium]HQN15802.1 dTDP-4-dehydrorhamnose reductase [Bacteroidales bacterium]HQP15438.1 dTDP-4-dehydrorhamnose reductase [Bacteroidales bacterium]